jgi:hypothetical protein
LTTQSVENCIPAGACGTITSTIVRRSASHACLDALRPLDDAERRDLHSHAGACGTITSTIVRRSASHAFPDALRPLDDAESRELHSHAGACGTITSTIVRRSASHAFPDALRPLGDEGQKNSSHFHHSVLTKQRCTFRASDDSRMNTWAGVDTPSPNLKNLTF